MTDFIYDIDMIAFCIFWIQHWTYVSHYTRVSVMIPLTFVYQSDSVKAKRKVKSIFLGLIDLAVYTFLVINMCLQLSQEGLDNWSVMFVWSVLSAILTIALYLSLSKIRHYTKALAT